MLFFIQNKLHLHTYMFLRSRTVSEKLPKIPLFWTFFNLLKLNVNYSGRTATLTSKVAFYIFIQQI